MKKLPSLLTVILFMVPALALAADPVADLQESIRSGKIRLDFDTQHGYLRALLHHLSVPISSQTLVFSKTSLQSEGISPKTPRAIYFNDNVYLAWVQGSSTIEIMSVDPQAGSRFYALGQDNSSQPYFELVTGHICSACHFVEGKTKFVPRLALLSVIPDASGDVSGTYPISTMDSSPLEDRWGGWYVTGTHGAQKHLGNILNPVPVSPLDDLSWIDFSKSGNVTDLSDRFDTSQYLSPHSDIVALLVLAHQVELHNLIALASASPEAAPKEAGEPLVKAMLFSGAAPLKEAVEGTSNFTAEFPNRGPRDDRGRSLRDFDLNTRLFRYPLSYMIYTKAFDEMPQGVKSYVYQRLQEILAGQDRNSDFMHLSSADRTAILEIVRATKTDFPR